MKRIHFAGGLLAALLTPITAYADWEVNMPVGVTDLSQEIYDLHMLAFWICVVIGIVLFGAMIYSMIYHRKSQGAVAASFHESTTAEIIWTVIPIFILIAMSIPAAKALVEM